MRCRKVRSYLSAYSSEELSDEDRLAVSEHISTCPGCRKEAVMYASVRNARRELSQLGVSDDFNTKLLNRIAQERFAETRTKAYLPHHAPRLAWTKLVPALATACLVLVTSIYVLSPQENRDAGTAGSGSRLLDDSYLTVLPTNNPNMAVPMARSWSLNDQLERAERVSIISNSLTRMDGFDWHGYSSGLRLVSQDAGYHIPYVPDYFKMRPVVRIYGLPDAATVKEVTRVY